MRFSRFLLLQRGEGEEEEISSSKMLATLAPEIRHGPFVVWQRRVTAVFSRISIL